MMAVDMFLKIDGIEGESTDKVHSNEIQIESFSFGVSNVGSAGRGGGIGAGKAHFEDIHFTKFADKASPMLMMKCAQGEHIPTALLTVRKAGGDQKDYYKIKFTDLIVSNFQNAGSGHDSTPQETLSLNFSKVEFAYAVQNKDGSLGKVSQGGWDLGKNAKV
jgi:type VI secretion system secreted protein Hcp